MSYNTLIKAGQKIITDENRQDWTVEKNVLPQVDRKPGVIPNETNLSSKTVGRIEQNKSAMEQQEVWASQFIQHLPTFCQREIENITKIHPVLCPKVIAKILEQLHYMLVDLLTLENIATSAVSTLSTVIQTACEKIQNEYLDDLQQKQAQVQRLVKRCKSKYEIDMGSFIKSDQFLEHNFTEDAYNDWHIQLKEQTIRTFTQDVVSELGKDEPVNKHLETLNYYLEKSKIMFRKKVEIDRPLPKGTNQMPNETPSMSNISTCLAKPPRETECKVAPDAKSPVPGNDNPSTSCSAPIKNYAPKDTLLVQLTKHKIGLAVTEYKDGKYTWRPVQQKLFVPFAVAMSSNNDWHYGMDIESKEGNGNLSTYQEPNETPNGSLYEGVWKLSSYFALPFSKSQDFLTGPIDTVKCNDRTYTITPQLLLSILFRIIRSELEGQQKIELEKVLIAVPAWYTSCCREQIKDAVKIAGFNDTQIHVINENVCLAFTFLKNSYPESEFNAVIVSENSGIQDTSVFTVDKEERKVDIVGYCGMQEMVKRVTLMAIICLLICIGRGQSDELAQQKRNALKEAKKTLGSRRPGNEEKKLLNFASNYNKSVFEGVTYLYACSTKNNALPLEYVLESVTPVKVFKITSDTNLKEKNTCQKFGKQRYVLKGKATKTNNYKFYQQLGASKKRFPFGTLVIKREAKKHTPIEVTLEMSPDGVILLREVQLGDTLLDDTAYTWESHLLNDKHRLEYEQILSKIYHKNKVIEEHVEENPTEQFVQEMQQALEGGQGLRLSLIAKTLVSKELDDIKCLLVTNKRQSNTSELLSLQQRLKNINDKYKLTGL